MFEELELGKKTELLNEAFHYVDRYNDKVVVIKYGGSAMENKEVEKSVLEDVVTLKSIGLRPVLVHGGGKDINHWSSRLGVPPTFVQGYRMTDGPTMEVVEMVLNRINKGIVKTISELGGQAVGISGKDADLLHVHKKFIERTDEDGEIVKYDIGFVGEIDAVNFKIVTDLLDNGYIPVICPVGFDDNYDTYNINADDAACAIATAMKSGKLAFVSDVAGVYENPSDPSTLISELDYEKISELLENGKIVGGMFPKLKNCQEAIKNGVERIHIMDARVPHSLLLEVFTDDGVGTVIHANDNN